MQTIIGPLFYPCSVIFSRLNCGPFKKTGEVVDIAENSLEALNNKLKEADDTLLRIDLSMGEIIKKLKANPSAAEKRRLLDDAKTLKKGKDDTQKKRIIITNAIDRINDVQETQSNLTIIHDVSRVVMDGKKNIEKAGIDVEKISTTFEEFSEMSEFVVGITDILGTPVVKSERQRAGLPEESMDDDDVMKMLQEYDNEDNSISVSRLNSTNFTSLYNYHDPYAPIPVSSSSSSSSQGPIPIRPMSIAD
jgi:hypothetical protein